MAESSQEAEAEQQKEMPAPRPKEELLCATASMGCSRLRARGEGSVCSCLDEAFLAAKLRRESFHHVPIYVEPFRFSFGGFAEAKHGDNQGKCYSAPHDSHSDTRAHCP